LGGVGVSPPPSPLPDTAADGLAHVGPAACGRSSQAAIGDLGPAAAMLID
jgi:hypothetical protein